MGIRILLFIVLLAGVAGCESEEEIPAESWLMELSPVVTRADISTPFEEGCSAGLFVESDGQFVSSNLSYAMKDGELAATNGQPLKFPDDKEQITLYAYSPFFASNRFNGRQVTVEISGDQQRDGTTSSDVLWGKLDVEKSSPGASLSFAHRMVRLIINLTSVSNADLAEAKVKVLSISRFVPMNVATGAIGGGMYDAYIDILAHKITTGCYEAIVPPERIRGKKTLFSIEHGGKSYTYSLEYADLESGKEYTYNIKLWDGDELPFTIELKYQNKLLGSSLNVPSTASSGTLVMTASSGYNYEKMALRSADGSPSWVYMDNGKDYGITDQLDTYAPQTLYFEENLSEASRSIELEFYDIARPKNVYKRVTVVQDGRTDRLDLSQPGLETDRYGNEYDVPLKLDVSSNLNWTLLSSADWIKPAYNGEGLNQTVYVTVSENTTGAPRTGTLKFLVDGKVYKEFSVSQSNTENSSFTLKYELYLELNTVDGKFKGNSDLLGVYYPTQVEIYNHYTTDFGDATAKITSEKEYGFITDFPTCNSIKVDAFASEYFIYRNYSGRAATLTPGTITITNARFIQIFFRQLAFQLPIPAGVKRNEKVIYHVKIDNIRDNALHSPAVVTSEVVKQ